MSFGQAIAAGFNRYVDFQGRSRRSELWWFTLFLFILSIGASVIDHAALGFALDQLGPASGIMVLATLIPSLAVWVRRLHDIGRSGWWTLLSIVPIIGIIVIIYWACQPSQPTGNVYGANPMTA